VADNVTVCLFVETAVSGWALRAGLTGAYAYLAESMACVLL
jgi:hypothetical protein